MYMILDAQENAIDQVIARGDTMFGVKMNGWFLNPANHGDWEEDFWNRSTHLLLARYCL